MKKLFICFGCLFPFLLFPTPIQAQPGEKGKWSVGVVFSPDYASRFIKFPDENEHWEEYLDENDIPILSYTTGISLLYSLNKKFEMESGLLLSAKGYAYKVPGEGVWQIPEWESFVGWEINDPAVPLEATTTYNYQYLDVPLKLNWFLLHKKVRLFLSAGISGSLFLNEFVVQEAIFPDRAETSRYKEEDVDFNPVVLSLTGGAGIEYPLSDRLRIRFNPEFRHAVVPIANTPGRYYLWSVGINTGMFINLQR